MFCVVLTATVFLAAIFFFFKQKTAYEMRISDWSSDVCSSDVQHIALAYKRLYVRTHRCMMNDLARWSLKVSRETDIALRTLLATRGGRKGDLSRFVEDAVNRAVLRETVRDVRERDRKSTRLNSSH